MKNIGSWIVVVGAIGAAIWGIFGRTKAATRAAAPAPDSQAPAPSVVRQDQPTQ